MGDICVALVKATAKKVSHYGARGCVRKPLETRELLELILMNSFGVLVAAGGELSRGLESKICLALGDLLRADQIGGVFEWISANPNAVVILQSPLQGVGDSRGITQLLTTPNPKLIFVNELGPESHRMLSGARKCGFVCVSDSPEKIQKCLSAAIKYGFSISSNLLAKLINAPHKWLFHVAMKRFSHEDVLVLRGISEDLQSVEIARRTNFSISSINRRVRKFREIFNASSKAELSFVVRNLQSFD